jgi:iron complex outermembrane receptor protein
LLVGTAIATLLPAMALAQEAPKPAPAAATPDQSSVVDTIVVTGTLIRGIAPVGSQVIGLSSEKVEAVGGNTTDQILNNLPQVGNFFNTMPVGVSPVSGSNGSNPISRPNLRNLPGANTSGGAQTLVLIDGHRVVPAGTQQLAVDPDIIAPGVIAKVEALTDGGSAIYGSDALGGVLNFVTRRSFEGFQATARYGVGDAYTSFNSNVLAGKDWGSGSIYAAYGYSRHDDIFGSDRDYIKRIDWNTGVPVGRNCAAPTTTIGTTTYVVSGAGLAAGPPNTCDPSKDTAVYPEATQNTVFGKLSQDITDALHFDVTGLYSKRITTGNGGTLGLVGSTTGTVTLTAANPFYRNTGDANAGQPQTVRFNYGPIAGYRSNTQKTVFDTWDVAPSFTLDLGHEWQLAALLSYGESSISYRNKLLSPTAQSAAVAAGTLNPYNIAATTPTVIAGILSGLEQGNSKNKLYNYRAVADGPLFHISGGDVRLAVGVEYMQDNFKVQQSNAAFVLPPFSAYSQNVSSAFAEINAPVVSKENGRAGLRELSLSASGRYDKYNDFGDTFNPKLGVTYRPIDWIALRGSWGESFNAPSPTDQLGPTTAAASLVPGQFLATPPVVAGKCGGSLPACSLAGQTGVFLGSGAISDLKPQTATTWSTGIELKPPVLPGLTLNASYYAIDLKGTLGRPVSGTSLGPYYANFPNLYIYQPTGQQLAAVVAGLKTQTNVGFTIVNPTSTSGAIVSSGGTNQSVGIILDTLVRNLGTTKLSGLDFSVSYIHDFDFGSVDASFAGNYRFQQDTRVAPSAPVVDELANETSKLMFQATAGTTIGKLRAQATLNHTSGYKRADAGIATSYGQDKVKPYNAVNLFFKYDVRGEGLTKDLSFTLNIDNVFDVDPPLYKNSSQPGYDPSHIFTLGRVFQIGVTEKF